MADELNVPTHRWYEPRNNIALPPNAVSPKYILANGVAMIDAWINSQPWGMPLYLFAANEPGWLYDNSDMSTLFQDSAGTTPVTAVGQPVGLQLDKSKGLALGPELVTNGDFSAGLTGWVSGSAIASSIVSGEVQITFGGSAALSGNNWFSQAGDLPSTTAFYKVTFDATWVSGGVLQVSSGFDVQTTISANAGKTSYSVIVRRGTSGTAANQQTLVFAGATGAVWKIDNISVKELAGTHRTQSTAASRPTFACLPVTGRRNLLTYTEQFDNAAWAKTAGGTGVAPVVTANSAIAPDGTMSADQIIFDSGVGTTSADLSTISYSMTTTAVDYTGSIWLRTLSGSATLVFRNAGTNTYGSVTATPDWQRFTRTELGLASTGQKFVFGIRQGLVGTINSSATVLAWGAQLELGSTATNYQKVVSLYDITEAGVQTAYGLYYDGVDDFLVTPTITPGTDKVQVFAGVRKLSDVATGIVLEASTSIGANNGSIQLAAPFSGANYTFQSRGTTQQAAIYTNAAVAAPVTSVLTGIGDISADISRLRVSGVQVAENLADQGTGNYLAYPTYFGRRGGTTLPFNGYTFREVGRFGPNLDTATIANVENWINQNTGAY